MSCCYSTFELLLGTWSSSACYQRVDVLSQLLDSYSSIDLLLGTWPFACYQRVDVLSQLLDSSLHVGFRNYQSSPTRRARTENKKVNDNSRSSVNTRDVSEGSMGVTDTLGPVLLVVLMTRCKTRKTFTSTRGLTGEYSSPATHVRVKAPGATFDGFDACVRTAQQRTQQSCVRTAGDIVSTAVCVCVCFLPIHSGHQVRWTYQPGSHRRKVTQDFSSTFFLRCVP